MSEQDVPMLIPLVQSCDCVVFGPGFGSNPESLSAAAQLIPYFKKAVIDADALRPEIFDALIQFNQSNASSKPLEIVLTPHYHELTRTASYFGINLPGSRKELLPDELESAALEISEKLGAAVLVKGREDLIANAGIVRYNATGNAGMSVGGTGDVLAGITGGLLAKNSAAAAACCGAYVCGKAGDSASEEKGDSLIPADILDKVPLVFIGEVDSKTKKEAKKGNEKGNKKEIKKT
ncbi:ADP-dependent (S)-NAD(P)H-hydrate dehydratase [Methanimicrococcus sp. At1]|uniref:ADP-dependent (S)-NAD(P)H-hydrate dehydratase n=1 Tax=Methanimicrococcus hacksteinii TaxID=3028293 RepID=A0ABU3VNC9_9EURY|nr:ADP-dependent (S)-NAD(P)H-hydrate dehydratase [Methanimicrococcus sp. At1]